MINNLAFDFTVDKERNMVFITKEFAADISLVWDAFTRQEILDQWGAPAPWIARTRFMNFEPGGHRLYAMIGPEGQEHWSIQEFTSIHPRESFTMLTNFTDKDGNITSGIKSSENILHFREANGITTVTISIEYASPAVLEMMIEKGFKQGFAMTMDNLDRILSTTLAR